MRVALYRQGGKAVFKIGKSVVEVPATPEKKDQRYATTGVVTRGPMLIEIDLGGTSERILLARRWVAIARITFDPQTRCYGFTFVANWAVSVKEVT